MIAMIPAAAATVVAVVVAAAVWADSADGNFGPR